MNPQQPVQEEAALDAFQSDFYGWLKPATSSTSTGEAATAGTASHDPHSNIKPIRPSQRRRKKSKQQQSEATEMKKRRLSAEQVSYLEMNFGNQHTLQSDRKARLASALGLDPRQVAVWFQNRRARLKSKQVEEEFQKLKAMYQEALAEKRNLESEVVTLKQLLEEAQQEMSRLSLTTSMPDVPWAGGPNFQAELEVVDRQVYSTIFTPEQEDDVNAYNVDWATLYSIFP